MSLPTHLRHTRLGRRRADIRVVQDASVAITELRETLDRRLLSEHRESERLRMLRETTNQVTRTANDAIQAYVRLRAALSTEIERPEGDHEAAIEMQRLLREARAEVLKAIETMNERYAWGYAQPDDEAEEGAAAAALPAAKPELAAAKRELAASKRELAAKPELADSKHELPSRKEAGGS